MFEWFKANFTPGAAGIYGLLGIVIAAYFKFKPGMTKLANEREVSLLAARGLDNAELRSRIDKLEAQIEEKDARHEAERALDRHRLNNALQCLDAIFLMFETAPEKAADVIAKVKEMRRQQLEAEAIEKATIHAATIGAKAEKAA